MNYLNGRYSVAVEPQYLQSDKGHEIFNACYLVGIEVELYQVYTVFQALNLLQGDQWDKGNLIASTF